MNQERPTLNSKDKKTTDKKVPKLGLFLLIYKIMGILKYEQYWSEEDLSSSDLEGYFISGYCIGPTHGDATL